MPYTDLQPDRNQATPIYLQLYQRFRDGIAQGRLRPGDRVPAVRSLAAELNLARGTVEMAYQLLTSEGYLLARGPAGTVISPQLPPHLYSSVALRNAPENANPSADARQAAPLPFQMGLPALDAFPRKLWSRLAARRLRSAGLAGLDYPDPNGYAPLREAVARYLGISRGIACVPEQVFITTGYRGALDLICRSLVQPGDACWFEDPGYFNARNLLEAAGVSLIPVPVDDQGLCVDIGLQRAAHARFAVVTPSHQSPLGVSLSLPRRLALLDWASSRQAWIIEDDYDSEYRYNSRPLPALKSLDRHGRVLYTGTFSKVLFPGLRLAYLVVPPAEVERFARSAQVFHHSCPDLLQATVSDFLDQGHFARHLKKMRSLYAVRRGYLLDALHEVFGERLHVDLQAGGIHLLARLADGEDDVDLAAKANAAGLAPLALSPWGLEAPYAPGLLMGFTNIGSAEEALVLARKLKQALS